jgi:hypothetical protein
VSRRALLVLASLLLLALPACGGGDDATAPADQEFPPTETGPVPPGGFTEDQVELAIEDQETNDIIGTAILSPEDETSTRVSVFLDVVPEGDGRAEIRGARCEEPDAEVVHELGQLTEGQVEGVVDAPLEDLMGAPHALWTVAEDDAQHGCALIAAFGVDVD